MAATNALPTSFVTLMLGQKSKIRTSTCKEIVCNPGKRRTEWHYCWEVLVRHGHGCGAVEVSHMQYIRKSSCSLPLERKQRPDGTP